MIEKLQQIVDLIISILTAILLLITVLKKSAKRKSLAIVNAVASTNDKQGTGERVKPLFHLNSITFYSRWELK